MTQPKFTPKPGQVDYTDVRYCPVVNVIPICDGKVLFVQRAADLTFYPGYWHCIAGFLDNSQSIEEKAYEELGEELGWATKDVLELQRGQIVLTEAPVYGKTYLVVPVLAKVAKTAVKLDWEASRAQWFDSSRSQGAQVTTRLPGDCRTVLSRGNERAFRKGKTMVMRTIHRTIVSALIFSKDGKLLMGMKDPKDGGVYALSREATQRTTGLPVVIHGTRNDSEYQDKGI